VISRAPRHKAGKARSDSAHRFGIPPTDVPDYRGKKDRALTWSARGSMPRWMREEMKELKLKPNDFVIRKAKE
jgi:hypothetical protein